MKQTAFYNFHQDLNAKMVPFAGFEMPVEYTGVKNEHLHVRNHAGLFDVSHMGEIWVKGNQAIDFLQYVTTNDVSKVSIGQCQYSCFPNGKGGIVDDLIIYHYSENKYMLVVNASNIDKDFDFLQKQNSFNVELENSSDQICQLAIQGPEATGLLQKLCATDLKSVKPFHFIVDEIAGIPEVIISNTGYTGAGGFELYFVKNNANAIWNALMSEGKDIIKPIGLAARDTLRLEMGYCLYGNDIDDTTSPIEAGLGWITKFNKDSDFIDKELLLNQKQQGVNKKLMGFVMQQRGIPRKGYKILNASGQEIGEVTSGTMSPVLNKGIGMGYIQSENAIPGQEIFIEIRNKKLSALIQKPPFI